MRHLRLFLVLAGLLAVAACSSSTTTSPGAAAASSAASMPIHVKDFTLNPLAVTSTGGSVSLAVTNDGPTIHNVTIRDSSGTVVAGTKDLQPGTSETLSTKLAPGAYILFCSLPGHESLGIKGTLTVSP